MKRIIYVAENHLHEENMKKYGFLDGEQCIANSTLKTVKKVRIPFLKIHLTLEKLHLKTYGVFSNFLCLPKLLSPKSFSYNILPYGM